MILLQSAITRPRLYVQSRAYPDDLQEVVRWTSIPLKTLVTESLRCLCLNAETPDTFSPHGGMTIMLVSNNW